MPEERVPSLLGLKARSVKVRSAVRRDRNAYVVLTGGIADAVCDIVEIMRRYQKSDGDVQEDFLPLAPLRP